MSAGEGAGATTSGRATVLERILNETREEIERRKRGVTLGEIEARAAEARAALATGAMVDRLKHSGASPSTQSPGYGGRFHQALARPGIGVIAEFKRRSPSAGSLREGAELGAIVMAYERGGASALSVLTEGPNFDGSLADIDAARDACGLPILRKDFVVDPYQLYEAVAAGADAVLLIVAALGQEELASLHDRALGLGLDVLVEVHDRDELACAEQVGARLIGVNNRDLRDFSVDVGRTERLLTEMPAGTTVVSESGISKPEQLKQLERAGVAAVLVGESLMRASEPERALAALLKDSSAPSF
ncbi:MAG TPA: indole-3-glycerol phosphate synthase TrpC [Solirubrobacteraceae bacterium]|jgi:indole-3-glycerol phosphate synthase|nr:indole-3-glycerol phosphate synthase TrpC [Solirubrobacteraceae bacterium]